MCDFTDLLDNRSKDAPVISVQDGAGVSMKSVSVDVTWPQGPRAR